MNLLSFTIRHPWSVFYNANQMVCYIEELKSKKNLSWRENGFMNNYSKYALH